MQPLITGLNHLVDMRDQLGASFNSDELLEGIALKASTWGIDLEFQTHYVLNPVPTVIEIAPNDDLQTLRNMFMSVEDKLQITAASIDAMVAKSLGEGGSRMNIDADVRQSLKNSLLRPAAALPVDTKVRHIVISQQRICVHFVEQSMPLQDWRGCC